VSISVIGCDRTGMAYWKLWVETQVYKKGFSAWSFVEGMRYRRTRRKMGWIVVRYDGLGDAG